MKPILLSKEFFPKTLQGSRDLGYFRRRVLSENQPNLKFLIEKRYEWMKNYIKEDDKGVEIGAGIGASKLILNSYQYLLTDCYRHEWIDDVVDAMQLPYKDASLDYIIASNVIHHLSKPMLFFEEAKRVLKPNGHILINDVNNGFFMRLLLRVLKHEGYSYDRDPFDKEVVCNNPNEPWSGNDAVADIMFSDKTYFKKRTGLSIESDQACEFLIFLFSGGVSSEFKTINLPRFLLALLNQIDIILSKFKSIFPLSRNTVLRKMPL